MKKYIIFFIGIFVSSCISNSQDVSPTSTVKAEFIPSQTISPTQKNTITPQPTSTSYPSYIINSSFPIIGYRELVQNYASISDDFSYISMDDILSGNLLNYEVEYINKNPIFTGEIINCDIRIITGKYFSNYGSYKTKVVFFDIYSILSETCDNWEEWPLRILSFYLFKDEELFKSLDIDPVLNDGSWFNGQWPFWLMTWAYHNPDGTVVLGHSLIEIFDFTIELDRYANYDRYRSRRCPEGKKFYPFPEFSFVDINMEDEGIRKTNHLALNLIYQKFPELLPEKITIDQWVSTLIMPDELQSKLFGLSLISLNSPDYIW